MIKPSTNSSPVLSENSVSKGQEGSLAASDSCVKNPAQDTFDAVTSVQHQGPAISTQTQVLLNAPSVKTETPKKEIGTPPPVVQSAFAIAVEVFPLAQDIRATELQGSYSGNVITRLDVDDKVYILKSIAPAYTPKTLTLMQKEIRLAIWACGENDLGPQVRAYDEARGFFVADFVDAQYTEWDDASREPKRSAIVDTLSKLHRSTQLDKTKLVGSAPDVAATASEVARLSAEDIADSRLHAVRQTITTLAARLSNMTYRPVRCHGDVHGGNALYTPQKLHLIDWEQSYVGDSMEELASLADQLGVAFAELPKLALDYKVHSNEDLLRLQLYYTIRLARRVVQGFVVMPWNADKVRDNVIDSANDRLRDALEALKLKSDD
jgi:thiamine kinase-like enzyme